MKSHLFPKFLIKNWILSCWNNDDNFNRFYTIDLYSKKYDEEIIDSETKIDYILKNKRTFYLNFDDKLAKNLEKEWNSKYESPFFNKIYKPLLNIYKQYFFNSQLINGKKIISYNKEISDKVKKWENNFDVITNFLILNIFRAEFEKGIFKIIDQKGNCKFRNPSESLFPIIVSDNEYEETFLKFQKSFNFKNHFPFLLPGFSLFMTNPAVLFYDEIFFAIPFHPFGYLCILDKQYKIFYDYNIQEFKFEKSNLNTSEIFIFDKEKINIKEVLHIFPLSFLDLWFRYYGIKKGEIYLVGNSKIIEEFMLELDNFHFFEKRKNYIEDKKNYNQTNTIFAFVK